MKYTLHDSNFDLVPVYASKIQRLLQKRAEDIINATRDLKDPDLSVVIRSRNDIAFIKELFEDIQAQIYDGKVEVIVVDTESKDGTAEYAKSQGAKVIPITQAEFNYAKALNLGFEAAQYPYVATLVGHSNLSNRTMFKAVTYWSQQEKFGGLYSLPIANKNASRLDRFSTMRSTGRLTSPKIITGYGKGMMSANASVVKREAWQKLGGYDEKFGGGGEDVQLARHMQKAGYMIVRDPIWSLFHSHGLSLINSLRQNAHWIRVGSSKPQSFKTSRVHKRRPDLRG